MMTNLPSPEQVKAAVAAEAEVERLNRPELDFNRHVRDENAACVTFFDQMLCWGDHKTTCDPSWLKSEILPEFLLQTKPLQHKLAPEHKAALMAERSAQEALRNRQPEVWLKLVESVPEHFRLAIASIVWWDFFSERECKERWPHLDRYIDRFWSRGQANDAPADVISAWLLQIGYTPYQVSTRLIGTNS